jgi:hypothetical protein
MRTLAQIAGVALAVALSGCGAAAHFTIAATTAPAAASAPPAATPQWSASCSITNPSAATRTATFWSPIYTIRITNTGAASQFAGDLIVIYFSGPQEMQSATATFGQVILSGQTMTTTGGIPSALTSPSGTQEDYWTLSTASSCKVLEVSSY